MANAPFQTAGNVQDIAAVQLRGGFTPDSGIAGAIADVAGIVVPAIRDNLETSITNDVKGSSKSIQLALQATRYPSIKDSLFSEESLANPTVAAALGEYTQIQDAVKQGRLPGQFALERLELIQNNAIKNAPEFEREIRGALQDATGQSPTKALFAQLISDAPGSRTAEQKGHDALVTESIKNGVSVDDQIAFNNSVMQATIENNRLDLLKKNGQYTANMIGGDVRNRSGVIMVDVLQNARQLVVAGQTFTPEVIAQLKSRNAASVAAASSSLIAQTSQLGIDGSVVQANMAPLLQMQTTIDKMIDDGSMELMVSSKNKVTTDLIKQSVLSMQDLAAAYALGGSQGFSDLLTWIEKSGNSPAGKALVGALSKEASLGFKIQDIGANIIQQYGQIGSATPVYTPADKQSRVLAGAVVLGTKGADEEFQISALNDMRKYGGDELTWSAFDSNKILTATAASNKLKAAFINLQVSTTAGLSQDLIQIASDASVDLNRLTLSPAGVLTVTPRAPGDRVLLSASGQTADATLQTYATRFNRANTISAKYSGAGLLPTSRYNNSQGYWDVVKGEAANAVVAPVQVKATVAWGRDENGNPIRINGGN